MFLYVFMYVTGVSSPLVISISKQLSLPTLPGLVLLFCFPQTLRMRRSPSTTPGHAYLDTKYNLHNLAN